MPTLARDSGRTLLGGVVSNACNVLVVLVIARMLGADALGQYTLAFAVRAILLLVCGLGMRTTMTRFVASYLARGDAGGVRGSVWLGVATPFLLAVVVAAVWFGLAGPLAAWAFSDPGLERPMQVVALSLPFLVLMDTALAATQGFSTMRAYTWIGQVMEPGLRLGLTLPLLLLGGDVTAACVALLSATVLTALAALVALVAMMRGVAPGAAWFPRRELAAFAAASWVASMATQGLLWVDVVILGVLVTSEEVGAYQVATRVVLVGTFVITALTAAMAPRIASAWATGDVRGVTERYVGVVLWCGRLTWPMLAGLVAVPSLVLHLFGSDFSSATSVVLVLCVGAAAEVLGAPSSVVLNQIGRNRLNMVLNLAALALNVVLNLVLVPQLGITGAALAWSVTLTLFAVVRVVVVRRVATGRWPGNRPLAVALVAALGSGLVAAGLTRLLPDVDLLRLVVAGLAVATVYGLVVLQAGLRREERDVVSRAITLRAPTLRRWRAAWQLRGAEAGRADVGIDEVISPFRADVLARAALFRLAREHADLRARDEAAFVALARTSEYGVWFDEVLVHRGHVTHADPQARERTFASIVQASLLMLDRHDRPGRHALGPVSITRVAAGTALDGWALAEDRWVLVDGGHRVALALVDGIRTLAPRDHVVVRGVVPPNNTARLLRSRRVSEADVVHLLARGLVPDGERAAVRTWPDLLDHLALPANRGPMEQWAELAPTPSANGVSSTGDLRP